MALTKEDLAVLQFPFKANEHEFLKDNAYITEGAITDRIETVDPSWTLEQISLFNRADSNQVVCTMRLTIKGVWRDGVGMTAITKLKSGAGDANEAEKAAATDALKRAARLFGIGRYLLDLPSSVVNVETLRNYLYATFGSVPNPLTTEPPPQKPAPQPSQPVTPPAASGKVAEPEPSRNARLQNEELTITKIVKTGMITGNPDPAKNGYKYDGWGKIVDGGTFDVRVWIYPEDVTRILAEGYGFNEGNDNHIPIIMDTTDRAMTRIGKVVPKQPENAGNGTLSAKMTYTVDKFTVNLTQKNQPYLIFAIGNEEYAYTFTRKPFEAAGYDVTTWKTVGSHEMPTPAEITVEMGKDGRFTVVAADMVDVFEKAG